MKATKTFDCVEMKNAIQAKLLEEMEGMSDEEERAYTARTLQNSDTPVGRLWRALLARTAARRGGR
jgi:hypothetical protein